MQSVNLIYRVACPIQVVPKNISDNRQRKMLRKIFLKTEVYFLQMTLHENLEY